MPDHIRLWLALVNLAVSLVLLALALLLITAQRACPPCAELDPTGGVWEMNRLARVARLSDGRLVNYDVCLTQLSDWGLLERPAELLGRGEIYSIDEVVQGADTSSRRCMWFLRWQ